MGYHRQGIHWDYEEYLIEIMLEKENRQGKSLLVISDTPFYKAGEHLRVFEPTLQEIEEVSDLFEVVTWVSYLRSDIEPGNARLTNVKNLVLKPIRDRRGGKSIWRKIGVLFSIPFQARHFYEEIRKTDIVHTRGPSVPALLVILYSFFDRKRIYWHKYAGNWNESNPPLAYRFQRWLLLKLAAPNVVITINGKWPGLHRGFISIENPCVKESYLKHIKDSKIKMSFSGKLRVCFVGSLDPNKGALRLVKALLTKDIEPFIEGIWIIGDGAEKQALEELARKSALPIYLPGYLSRQKIFDTIYSTCHLMLLPSITEGFPKVVAEAAAHRCIPVVTTVSALGQYIQDGVNGFLLEDSTSASIQRAFLERIRKHSDLEGVSNKAFAMAHLFTYERFRNRIEQDIVSLPRP